MSEQDLVDAIKDVVEAAPAADPKTFDVLSVVKGREYPTDDVTIFVDHSSAHKAAILERRINDSVESEGLGELEAQRNELLAKVKASALKFHLKGLPQEVRDAINKKVDAEFGEGDSSRESSVKRGLLLLAAHITSVENAEGAKDNRVWTPEDLQAFADSVPGESFSKFQAAVDGLGNNVVYFEQSGLNPDF